MYVRHTNTRGCFYLFIGLRQPLKYPIKLGFGETSWNNRSEQTYLLAAATVGLGIAKFRPKLMGFDFSETVCVISPRPDRSICKRAQSYYIGVIAVSTQN